MKSKTYKENKVMYSVFCMTGCQKGKRAAFFVNYEIFTIANFQNVVCHYCTNIKLYYQIIVQSLKLKNEKF